MLYLLSIIPKCLFGKPVADITCYLAIMQIKRSNILLLFVGNESILDADLSGQLIINSYSTMNACFEKKHNRLRTEKPKVSSIELRKREILDKCQPVSGISSLN